MTENLIFADIIGRVNYVKHCRGYGFIFYDVNDEDGIYLSFI